MASQNNMWGNGVGNVVLQQQVSVTKLISSLALQGCRSESPERGP